MQKLILSYRSQIYSFGMAKLKVYSAVVLLLGCLVLKLVNGCSQTPWKNKPDHSCSTYKTMKKALEIYRDVKPTNESSILCCLPDDPDINNKRKEARQCIMSGCHPQLNWPMRYINGKLIEYDDIFKEECTLEGGKTGYTGVFCPKNSLEGQLASAYGAEPHEFPHMAKLLLPQHCGGTIYNEQYIITAAHCVVSERTLDLLPATGMKVIIGSNSGVNENSKYVYEVDTVISHPEYSRLQSNPNYEKMKAFILNDIALLKLKKSIRFGPNVKALKIADKGFDPRAYADQAIIAGWGRTNTMATSVHLQKTDFILRDPFDCFSLNKTRNKYGPYGAYEKYQDQLLCVGGILEGKWSPTTGKGDSGGPAICRGSNGIPVLCGVTSFGGSSDEECLKHSDEENCIPSMFTRVSSFHDWIKKEAGEPADEQHIYKPYLYGKPVSKEEERYDHQVHITSDTGKPCGGTLVSQDVVITAASCVANDYGTVHSGIQVHYGFNELENGKAGKPFNVSATKIFKGFQMPGEKVNITSQGNHVRITDNYYNNNLAAIKINGKAPISPSKLPELPESGDIFVNGTEIAFPRSSHHGGKLLLRDFDILDKEECQKRMKRLAKADGKMGGGNTKVSGDILCGVEKYSGGSLCDRELGGGLICDGKNGKDVLCGVQIFRLCEWSLPNAFMDMSQKSRWVNDSIKTL